MFDLTETEHAVFERCGQRIRCVTRPDFTETIVKRGEERRMHLFLVPDSRTQPPSKQEIQCGGPGFCRECNLEGETK